MTWAIVYLKSNSRIVASLKENPQQFSPPPLGLAFSFALCTGHGAEWTAPGLCG